MREFFSNLKKTWYYAREYRWELVKYIFCNFIGVILSVILPILSANMIISLTNNAFEQLIYMALIIFILENINSFISYFAQKYSQMIYCSGMSKIQFDLGGHMLQLQNTVMDEHSSGVFIQRLSGDTSRLADVFNILNMYVSDIISNIGIFIAVFIINKIAFCFLLIMVCIIFLIEKKRVERYNQEDKKFRQEQEKVTGFTGELVRGLRDIKMLNAEKSFLKEFQSRINHMNQKKFEMSKRNYRYYWLIGIFYDLKDFLLIILLVFLIKKQQLEIASALVIYNYSSRVTQVVYSLGYLLENVKNFNLSAERVFSIMDSKKFSKEVFGSKKLQKVEGNFAFHNVSFSYNEQSLLKNLNFQIHANETVAFVGKSGVGKTTIFNLLCKMYDVKEGKITIDGIDIKELDRESIRGNITIINQNPYIFNLSIRDNLRLVKENATEEEMKTACKIACLDEFIETLPKGYDTMIGEGGINLSGGQKQRLAIARALIQKTEIILFDEATSALDNETQLQIQKAIEQMKGEYTILIIAHRLSTIINTDRILVLKDGQIEAEGTHEELIKYSSEYRHLYETEIKK